MIAILASYVCIYMVIGKYTCYGIVIRCC